ncbi:MAG: YihY/virulence factor BrkB family protein [Candidatus Limnocylindria bacterium]
MIERAKRLAGDLDRWSLRHRAARVTRRAVSGFLAHEALQYAGSMAYFGVLSIFQLLVLAVVVISFVAGEGAGRAFVLDQVTAGSPIDRETVAGVIDASIESRGQITIIGLAFLLWSGLGVFSALSGGIGRAFEAAPRRGLVKDKLVGLLLMGLTGLLALASLVIGIVTGVLQRLADDAIGGLPGQGIALNVIGSVVPIILIFFAFWIIYRVVPNRPVTFGEVWPGAVVAAALWTILRFGFTYYATNVADYDSAFGPIATAVTLLVFLYFASVIVLLGAEFARANALDDELAASHVADPRLLPVAADSPVSGPGEPTRRRGGLPRWAFLAGGALIGLVAGRLTKRDEE